MLVGYLLIAYLGGDCSAFFSLLGFVKMVESIFEAFDLFCKLNGLGGGVCGCISSI